MRENRFLKSKPLRMKYSSVDSTLLCMLGEHEGFYDHFNSKV